MDSVFRLCKPSSFKGKLKKLHNRSYDINDLIEMHVNQIHPLELVANSLNFQNIQSIDNNFSILIGKPFFNQTKKLKWRFKDKPETESEISHANILALQEIFEARHQLIHNPERNFSKTIEDIEDKIDSALGLIMASDLVLIQFINENVDLEVTQILHMDKKI
jgi:hypothetical protein